MLRLKFSHTDHPDKCVYVKYPNNVRGIRFLNDRPNILEVDFISENFNLQDNKVKEWILNDILHAMDKDWKLNENKKLLNIIRTFIEE